ncbi:hypothetical protein H6778_03230 [Candidatus Nomurabacteria bacterium]|nr:hypothetical protein [Candidatus Nomurabacteria bacterium]
MLDGINISERFQKEILPQIEQLREAQQSTLETVATFKAKDCFFVPSYPKICTGEFLVEETLSVVKDYLQLVKDASQGKHYSGENGIEKQLRFVIDFDFDGKIDDLTAISEAEIVKSEAEWGRKRQAYRIKRDQFLWREVPGLLTKLKGL